jgi:AAA+ ATPase superfamily predicted ATPase
VEFFDRTDELAALEDLWDAREARFFVLWGRRRVGKTELLTRFAEGRRALYFEATDTTGPVQLRNLSQELALASGDELLAQQPLTNWPAALAAIARFASTGERTIVVLDEFQFLAARQRELATLLNRWWRTTGRTLPLVLVLAGSEVSFFRDDVLAGAMYGRRDGQLQLTPFDHHAAALFTPGYSAEDRVRTFAVCGGMPYYLARFRDDRSLADNILGNVLHRDGFLHEEADLLLRQELRDPRQYFSVLEAIAGGATRNSQIAARTGLDTAQTNQHLVVLERLQLVEQRRPATASPRSKRTSYAILDGFLDFSFRFVEPYRSRLRTRADAERHLRMTVLPALDAFVSRPCWERICRDHVRRHEQATHVGPWWGKVQVEARRTEERELDVVAVGGEGRVLATGSCKWTNAPLDYGEEALLTQLEASIPGAEEVGRHWFFSRGGFTDRMRQLAEAEPERIRLVTPQDVYTAAP